MPQKKILLVDDSKSARFALRLLLQKNNLEVEMAESGENALEKLKEIRPDVIFMDHLMPGLDGFETTKKIKADANLSAIPVVMCTSNEGDDYLAQAKSIGASGVLPKPATQEQLEKVLATLEQEMAAAAPAPVQEAVAAAPAISTSEIEAIAAQVAEKAVATAVTADMIKPLVAPIVETVLNERLQAFEQQMVATAKKLADEIAHQVVGESSEQLRQDIMKAIPAPSEPASGGLDESAVKQLLDQSLGSLNQQINDQFGAKLAGVKDDTLKAVIEDSRMAAQITGLSESSAETKATEIAKKLIADAQTAIEKRTVEIAKKVSVEAESALGSKALDAANQAAEQAAAKHVDALQNEIKGLNGKIIAFAGGAAAVGVIAAVVIGLVL